MSWKIEYLNLYYVFDALWPKELKLIHISFSVHPLAFFFVFFLITSMLKPTLASSYGF